MPVARLLASLGGSVGGLRLLLGRLRLPQDAPTRHGHAGDPTKANTPPLPIAHRPVLLSTAEPANTTPGVRGRATRGAP
ncbi:hypothetical protein SR39_02090 [Methylobacterium radiotolerans]|nr:hypothetical protein SR39_02090 [Methylobacterium radiotolerans]